MSRLSTDSNEQLLRELHTLVKRDWLIEADLIAHLGEVDARKLYLQQACSSMFQFCVDVLHFSEGVAYKRIAVARAARRFPELRDALGRGELHLTGASLIAPHLDDAGASRWILLARNETARRIKQMIADHIPKATPVTSMRRAPATRESAEPRRSTCLPPSQWLRSGASQVLPETSAPSAPAPSAASASPSVPKPQPRAKAQTEPLGSERYCIRFVVDAQVHDQIEELQALLRHQIPDGDVAKVLAQAVGVLLEKVRKQKFGDGVTPRSAKRSERSGSTSQSPTTESGKARFKTPSRNIPASIRRAVWSRDSGRCAYSSRNGRRCRSRDFIEFHHQIPWAHCHQHEMANIALRCRAHNQYEAELDFGPDFMAEYCEQRGPRPLEN